MKVKNSVCLSLLLLMSCSLSADIVFSDSTTAFRFGSGGSFLIDSTAGMSKIIGSLEFANSGLNLSGATSNLFCNDATFDINGARSIIFTGTYDPTYTYSIILNGLGAALSSYQQGRIFEKVTVCGSGPVLGGLCSFGTPNAISLSTNAANLKLELLTELSQNIVMNGGTVTLGEDLICGDDVLLTGTGTVVFNGYNMATGQKDLVWTGTLLFTDAKNMVFGANSRVTGRWMFNNTSAATAGHILGGVYALDLTNGGQLSIRPGCTLELSNIKIKGFGSGKILFGDINSKIIMNNTTIVLDSSRSFTDGHFLINGPCTFITGSNLLYFSSTSNFTVDGANVVYDTLGYNDNNNIRFASLAANRTYLNGGAIKKNQMLWVGDYNVPGPTSITPLILDQEFFVSALRKMNVTDSSTIDGAGFYIQFARHPLTTIFTLGAGKYAKFTNILLKDFPAQNNRLEAASQLIFGDGCNVELGENAVLTTTWYFDGQSVMNGNGKVLRLGTGGSLVLRPGAGVLFDNITIQGIKNTLNGGVASTNIRCMDNTATLSLGTIVWTQDSAFTMSNGHFELLGIWDIMGSTTFCYAGTETCTITKFGTMLVDNGMTFSYAPRNNNRDLIWMENESAILHLNGATLASTTTGLRLTRGTLIIDGICTTTNYDPVTLAQATSDSQAIAFGRGGHAANELTVIFNAGGTLDVTAGKLLYDNAS